MKLKEFNPSTCPSNRQSSILAQVGISMKVGVFNFNKPASDLIGLKDGDQVLVWDFGANYKLFSDD